MSVFFVSFLCSFDKRSSGKRNKKKLQVQYKYPVLSLFESAYTPKGRALRHHHTGRVQITFIDGVVVVASPAGGTEREGRVGSHGGTSSTTGEDWILMVRRLGFLFFFLLVFPRWVFCEFEYLHSATSNNAFAPSSSSKYYRAQPATTVIPVPKPTNKPPQHTHTHTHHLPAQDVFTSAERGHYCRGGELDEVAGGDGLLGEGNINVLGSGAAGAGGEGWGGGDGGGFLSSIRSRLFGGDAGEVPRTIPMKIEPKTYFANERTFLSAGVNPLVPLLIALIPLIHAIYPPDLRRA